jgi:hypothetical protein
VPTYSIKAPDGKTYEIDGPEGATTEQVKAEVIRQHPHLSGAPPAPAKDKSYLQRLGESSLAETEAFLDPNFQTVARTGLTDMPVAVGEMTGLVSPQALQQREADYRTAAKQVGPMADFGRGLYGAVGTAPLAFIPGAPAGMNFLGRVGVGAATGAGVGAIAQPTSGQGNFLDRAAEKGQQILLGTVLGSGTGLLNEGASWLANKLSARTRAQALANQTIPPNQLAAVTAANTAQPDVLASQAAAAQGLDLPAYQALLRMAESVDPAATARATRLTNQAAHLAELQRIAGGATATENVAAQNAAMGTLRGTTAQQREAALTGAMSPKTIAVPQTYGPLGEPRAMPTTAIREGVDVTPLTAAVHDIRKTPGIRASDVANAALSQLDTKLRDLAKLGDGYINPEDLYTVRKQIGNYIKKAAKENQDWDKKLTGGLQNSLQDEFDAAIEKAGGAGWKDYLATYSAGMQGIDRQALAARAMDLYKKSPQRFVALIQGESPAEVEKIFGPGTYDIVKALPTDLPALQKIASEVQAGLSAREQAKEGAKALTGILARNAPNSLIPQTFNPAITVGRTVLKGLEGKVNAKTIATLTKAAQSGASMNDLLLMAPASERSTIIAVLRQTPAWAQMGETYFRNNLIAQPQQGAQQ